MAGLVLIAVACVFYTDATPFPGSAAAVPVVGSALVLLAGAGGPGDREPLPIRALGVRPMRVVGDWSYSLYLWHWPVLIIAERRRSVRPRLLADGGLPGRGVRAVRADLPVRRAAVPVSPLRFPIRRALALYPAAVALVVGARSAATTTASTRPARSATTRRSR